VVPDGDSSGVLQPVFGIQHGLMRAVVADEHDLVWAEQGR